MISLETIMNMSPIDMVAKIRSTRPENPKAKAEREALFLKKTEHQQLAALQAVTLDFLGVDSVEELPQR
jgi:hypothetical protein